MNSMQRRWAILGVGMLIVAGAFLEAGFITIAICFGLTTVVIAILGLNEST